MIELGRIPKAPALAVDDVLGIARPKGLRVLLLSLGDGELGKALAEEGATEVVGLDACAGGLARARVTALYAIDPDACPELPYPEGYFDLIVLGDFSRLCRPEKTLAHLGRWLADEGRLTCVAPNAFHEASLAVILGGRGPEHKASRDASVSAAMHALRSAGFELEDEIVAVRTEPGAAADKLFELAVALGRNPATARDHLTLVRAILGARPRHSGREPQAPILDPWRGSRPVKVLFTPDLARTNDPWAASLVCFAKASVSLKNVTIGVTLPAERLSSPPPEIEKAVHGLDLDVVLIEEPLDASGWERLLAGTGTWIVTSDRPLQLALARHVGVPHDLSAMSKTEPARPLPCPVVTPKDLPNLAEKKSKRTASSGCPRFSIMVPTYNQAHFLPATLESLLAQSFRDWEAVVVNDGSTDATEEVLAKFSKRDARIRPVSQANAGVGAALNRALAESRGEWICWCSSDDLFMPNKLEVHESAMREDPSTRFWHTGFLFLQHESGQFQKSADDPKLLVPPLEEQVVRFLQVNYVNGISIAVDRQVLSEVGGFDPSLHHGQDYDAWLRVSARVRSRYIDRPTCVTRVHSGQGSARFFEAGILDSAWAGATFVEERGFAALFPALDLGRADHALIAVASLLRVALSRSGYVTYAGFEPLLLDHAKSFLAKSSSHVREHVRAGLLEALPTASDLRSRLAVEAVANVDPGFERTACDLSLLLERRATTLESLGAVAELKAVRRYQKTFVEGLKANRRRRAS